MRIYLWFLLAHAFLSGLLFAQTAPGTDGINGEAPQYGAGWWIWTVILLLIVAFIVWWAVRAGSTGRGSGTGANPKGRGMAGGT